MFYRIKDNQVLDYADFKYTEDCLETDLCTMREFDINKDNFIVSDGEIAINPNIEEIKKAKRKAQFESEFFETSLGWIRRRVNMKDGSKKDFLSDLLLSIKAGLELGVEVKIITYKTPDYTKEPSEEYMKSLQEIKSADSGFIQECLNQTVKDFGSYGG